MVKKTTLTDNHRILSHNDKGCNAFYDLHIQDFFLISLLKKI